MIEDVADICCEVIIYDTMEEPSLCLQGPNESRNLSDTSLNSAVEEVDASLQGLPQAPSVTLAPRLASYNRPSNDYSEESLYTGPTSPATMFRFSRAMENSLLRLDSPLPPLTWGNSYEVFEAMSIKDLCHQRYPNYLRRHPDLSETVRSIVLYWLMEVAAAHKLHRSTYHLAVDFFDRYLGKSINIERHEVQLIATTALFCAAKIEEIYPPRAVEFAYMTDGLCTHRDIFKQEMKLFKILGWELNTMTANGWQEMYMQLLGYRINYPYNHDETSLEPTFFSGQSFVKVARLLDLCLLDAGCLQFSYGLLAAAAFYHHTDYMTTCNVSGYSIMQLEKCIEWSLPFYEATRTLGEVHMKTFENVLPSEYHTIQTLDVSLTTLEQAQTSARENKAKMERIANPFITPSRLFFKERSIVASFN
ncbi:G1/S-specific cyclin-E1-like [Watersipora subatra]|uniref:G1/S-specific cyclin-E1-like n=1 Tax=Watersipora subatra TaxID=2589382 RepID=UPI00355C17E7